MPASFTALDSAQCRVLPADRSESMASTRNNVPGEYLNSFNDFSNSSLLRSGSAEWEPARRHVTFSPGYAMNRHHAAIKDHCTEHRGTPIPIKKHSSAANKTAKNRVYSVTLWIPVWGGDLLLWLT